MRWQAGYSVVMNNETQGVRRERNIECFSRGLEIIRAIRAMWDMNKKEWATMPWPTSATINPRRRDTMSSPQRAYLLVGGDFVEAIEVDLEGFIADNELHEDDIRDLRALQPGQEFVSGGGAWGAWSIRCVVDSAR